MASGKGTGEPIPFAPMTSIMKKPSLREDRCSEWIATEKVHGASFQFYTRDGEHVHMGSRTRCLAGNASFQKCDLAEFEARYSDCVKRVFHAVSSEERWQEYRKWEDRKVDGGEDDSDNEDVMAMRRARDLENSTTSENGNVETNTADEATDRAGAEVTENGNDDNATPTDLSGGREIGLEVRIYGELYGGGGVHKDIKPAVQKEIIYSDEFRFYVFGITINRKWVNIAEMNDLCKDAGFPYFAEPVCEARPTLEELKEHLITSGFMTSKSRLTDREGEHKTHIEGVVMSPLIRPDFRHHAIKFLSEAFNDVRRVGKGKDAKVNYCTKARYLSVISKLDEPEREDVTMVTSLFIEDIEKESGEPLSINKRKGCVRAVHNWLTSDGYGPDAKGCNKVQSPGQNAASARTGKSTDASEDSSTSRSTPLAEAAVDGDKTEDEDADMSFGGIFD